MQQHGRSMARVADMGLTSGVIGWWRSPTPWPVGQHEFVAFVLVSVERLSELYLKRGVGGCLA